LNLVAEASAAAAEIKRFDACGAAIAGSVEVNADVDRIPIAIGAARPSCERNEVVAAPGEVGTDPFFAEDSLHALGDIEVQVLFPEASVTRPVVPATMPWIKDYPRRQCVAGREKPNEKKSES